MTGNVVKSEVDALCYIVPSMAEKHASYGKLVGTKECRTNRDRYNRIQLYAAEKAENRRGRDVSVLCENTRPRDQGINRQDCCIGTPITQPRSQAI
jgi:hypothetical protein